ncbi:hypothetical protein [Photobacterium phosphoreum]|uniref:hypothetical protein n=1 Tax=Photobacterium phosphoreum TaxID=659 RepID=UPI0024B65A64|nr:hypothetical protein [Photobacterium phosphoreum]
MGTKPILALASRTQAMKGLLQQHKDRIGAQLVRSKKSPKSLSLYSNIQQHGQ